MRSVLLIACLSVTPACAQVYRCTTPSGGIEYSQTPCGNDAKLLQNRKDSIDPSPPSNPYAWVERQQNARLAREAAARAQAGSAPVQATLPATGSPHSDDCINAERSIRVAEGARPRRESDVGYARRKADVACGRPIGDYPMTEQAKRSVPGATTGKPPTTITNCDSGGCWGSDGTRYSNAAGGIVGPNGFCPRTASGFICQ